MDDMFEREKKASVYYHSGMTEVLCHLLEDWFNMDSTRMVGVHGLMGRITATQTDNRGLLADHGMGWDG